VAQRGAARWHCLAAEARGIAPQHHGDPKKLQIFFSTIAGLQAWLQWQK
jgi:hypothetical protein